MKKSEIFDESIQALLKYAHEVHLSIKLLQKLKKIELEKEKEERRILKQVWTNKPSEPKQTEVRE